MKYLILLFVFLLAGCEDINAKRAYEMASEGRSNSERLLLQNALIEIKLSSNNGNMSVYVPRETCEIFYSKKGLLDRGFELHRAHPDCDDPLGRKFCRIMWGGEKGNIDDLQKEKLIRSSWKHMSSHSLDGLQGESKDYPKYEGRDRPLGVPFTLDKK
jgi:hypothetical protein